MYIRQYTFCSACILSNIHVYLHLFLLNPCTCMGEYYSWSVFVCLSICLCVCKHIFCKPWLFSEQTWRYVEVGVALVLGTVNVWNEKKILEWCCEGRVLIFLNHDICNRQTWICWQAVFIVSLEPYCRKKMCFRQQLCLKVHINWRLQPARPVPLWH